jgi:mannonate dehydratase
MGVTHCFTWIEREHTTVEFLSALRQRLERAGIVLYNVGNRAICKNADIILATPRKEEAIQDFINFLQTLAEARIHLTTFTWEAEGVVWNTHTGTTRGDSPARGVSQSVLERIPLTRARAYSEDELWDSLAYFLERVIPVAESLKVRLALHPNDPPIPAIGGIPCLMRNKAAYERVFSMCPSPFLGMEFCCGCWLEGGERFGNLYEALPEFVDRKRVFIVHLRNVTSPLPVFTETFMDAGYGSIYRILRSLVRHSYEGTVILDHTPEFVESAGKSAASCYAVGYMRASIRAAMTEMQLQATEAL